MVQMLQPDPFSLAAPLEVSSCSPGGELFFCIEDNFFLPARRPSPVLDSFDLRFCVCPFLRLYFLNPFFSVVLSYDTVNRYSPYFAASCFPLVNESSLSLPTLCPLCGGIRPSLEGILPTFSAHLPSSALIPLVR